ncbi:MAG TPA: ABC transporter ATP-binding protein [Alphaproteobacteria bacterium]|nr:ABC transporter ATP-binding protein [Alphaproteobacteria bacterium]
MAANEPVIAVENLSLSFQVGGERLPALKELSLSLHRDEILGLVGESGSGKSTALFAIMNYLPENAVVEAGAIRYRGVDLLEQDRAALDRIRGNRLAMVYQDPGAALNPSIPLGRQIAEALERHLGLAGGQARRRTLELLRLVQLEDAERVYAAYPHQLSGGMRQRVVIAMALSCDPDALLMDEPTTALDVIVQGHVLELVRRLRSEVHAATLFVSHDIGAVAKLADRIGVLYAGELMELGSAEAVLRHSRNPYTRGLLAAVPRISGRARLQGIPGTASRAPSRFAHCVFADRCPAVAAICRAERPALIEIPSHGLRSRCHFAAQPEKLAGLPRAHPAATADAAASGGSRPLLEVRGLSVAYRRPAKFLGRRGEVVAAVRNVSFRLMRERVLGIVGESGSGKSTIARAILRLEPRTQGEILFEGRNIFALDAAALRRFRRSVQIVFQNPMSSLNPRKTIAELVGRPLLLDGVPARKAQERVLAVLDSVGLGAAYLDRLPRQLSGGERQRVALARAFVTNPALVILDEPTTALDVSVQATILELLLAQRRRLGCAYLFISHDLAVVRQVADEVLVLRHGEVQEVGPVATMFEAPAHSYTRALLAAVPSPVLSA